MQQSSLILCWSPLSLFTPSDTLFLHDLGICQTSYRVCICVGSQETCTHTHTHRLSFFFPTNPHGWKNPFHPHQQLYLHCSSLSCMNYCQAVWAERFTISAGTGLLESGFIAVPVILQGCHRRRNRKSIKAPMNQHSWPARLGQCATMPAAPPLHCLSPSLNPMSAAE